MSFSPEGLAFIAFVFLLLLGGIIGSWSTAEEREEARKEKELSDAEYQAQQDIHKGDC